MKHEIFILGEIVEKLKKLIERMRENILNLKDK
jgi:hypothetical protein